jgi:hypothetical protein
MTTKTKIMLLSALVAASYAGFFIYQRRLRQKANQSVVTLEQAYLILDKQK